MSKYNVKQLKDLFPDLQVSVYGKYFVVQDGPITWTGYCSDVTDVVIRKVERSERNWEEGYDELCQLVDYIEDEKILNEVRRYHGTEVSSF